MTLISPYKRINYKTMQEDLLRCFSLEVSIEKESKTMVLIRSMTNY